MKRKREVDIHQQSRPSKRARVEQQLLPTSASRKTSSSHTTWTESNAKPRRHEQIAAGIARGDFRYVAPCGNLTDFEDKWNLNQSLELTRVDCFH
ncbi:hypothetical protein ABVK25_005055 [Lepraria finkii]|uniref:Uncharacterized protein n=1 Tax=Lepraria finkii TaxID=1340010 RepID=A0ABR4BD25_9LECA